MITPREIIRDYLTMLNILRDNPDASFDTLLSRNGETEAKGSEGVKGSSEVTLSDIEF